MQNISEIETLIKLISKLPGLGPKSAKRIVLKLINNRDELVKPMANSLAQVYKNVVRCKACGTLKSNSNGCLNCNDVKNKISDGWIMFLDDDTYFIHNNCLKIINENLKKKNCCLVIFKTR